MRRDYKMARHINNWVRFQSTRLHETRLDKLSVEEGGFKFQSTRLHETRRLRCVCDAL